MPKGRDLHSALTLMSANSVEAQQAVKAEAKPHPTYSIVAPVFNEEETIPHFY